MEQRTWLFPIPEGPLCHGYLPWMSKSASRQSKRLHARRKSVGTNRSTTQPIGPTNSNPRNQGKLSVIAVETRDTLLAIAHRNPHQTCVSHGSDKGNAACNRDPVEHVKIGQKNKKNPPMWGLYVMIGLQKREHENGSWMWPMKTKKWKTTSSPKLWGVNRVFRMLKPDGLGESYKL